MADQLSAADVEDFFAGIREVTDTFQRFPVVLIQARRATEEELRANRGRPLAALPAEEVELLAGLSLPGDPKRARIFNLFGPESGAEAALSFNLRVLQEAGIRIDDDDRFRFTLPGEAEAAEWKVIGSKPAGIFRDQAALFAVALVRA
jgi:hypothetical protein